MSLVKDRAAEGRIRGRLLDTRGRRGPPNGTSREANDRNGLPPAYNCTTDSTCVPHAAFWFILSYTRIVPVIVVWQC